MYNTINKEENDQLHITWPYYAPGKSDRSQLLGLVSMINERLRERLPTWEIIAIHPDHFSHFFHQVLHLICCEDLSFSKQISLITFLNNCFNSLEVDLIRREVGKLCSLPIWINLLPSQRNYLLERNSKLKIFWTKAEQKLQKLSREEFVQIEFARRLLWRLLQKLKRTLDFIDDESQELDLDAVTYCERVLSLLIDLEAQLTTRRFFNSLLLSSHVITHCMLSQLIRVEHGSLFCELLNMLKFYARFEIDDVSGQQMLENEVTKKHYESVSQLQTAAFKFLGGKVTEFCLLPVGSVDSGKILRERLSALSFGELYQLAEFLHMVPQKNEVTNNDVNEQQIDENYTHYDRSEYLIESIVFLCERCPSQLQRLNAEPLYPSEHVIWDEKLVPYEHFGGHSVLPINKLNLQFLTIHDYLLRNFNLFRMESTYEIRQDIEDVLFRMKPWKHEFNENEVVWGGWAKMALPINACRIVHIGKPLVGEFAPSDVCADLQITLTSRNDLREEWSSLRRNDVLFLLRVNPIQNVGYKFDMRRPFKEQFGNIVVRGCEVEGILNAEGRVLDEIESRNAHRKLEGDSLVYRVRFDPNQYKEDADNGIESDIYFSFNLVIRRDAKTNNFKAVLATIRQLLNTECVVPDWLHDLILGYGEPDVAHYSRIMNTVASVDFNDTFLSIDHLKKSFPEKDVVCEESDPQPPFRLTFNEFVPQHAIDSSQHNTSIIVENQKVFNRILTEAQHNNSIEFTPKQVEAIKSGMQPGLTLVVGPPGTGKTDVAVQIISNIYHNWPEQRTLIVTHSNQALNQIFEKIINLDVDERHLLRMGHGEEELETEKDFSRYGRVNYVLAERQRLLKRVEKLCESMNEDGDVAYSCETAGYFFRYNVCKTWEYFLELVGKEKENQAIPSNDFVVENFPFTNFFQINKNKSNYLPLEFKRVNFAEDFHTALEGWNRITDIFKKLEEFRAFELLRNGRDRADYLLVKESKIIAMTCTHAALRRRELVELGFRYDNILMEEAAQILEVETFIPLLLQNPKDGRSRLKRWIMIGDHHQLPPIVQNMAYQKYANMEQSLFARLIRLGVPHVELDAQGRARSELASLYNWRYAHLGDLSHISVKTEFKLANPGFAHTFQLVDVPDFNGVGENMPSAYFYQNLGEAEYAIALFVYMRILGYPPERISILTTYNGQASLLRDVVQRRCAHNPFIGVPGRISTVDKYQGQQNDYIILSLVRTKAIGHLRDVRRLIVALSRARLGLYILCRVQLFNRCYELLPAFERLLKKPTKLILIPSEQFCRNTRKVNEKPSTDPIEIVDTQHMSQFVSEFYRVNIEVMKSRKCINEQQKELDMAEPVPTLSETEPEEQHDKKEVVNPSSEHQQKQVEVERGDKPEEADEGAIVFEQVDFERLQNIPKYG